MDACGCERLRAVTGTYGSNGESLCYTARDAEKNVSRACAAWAYPVYVCVLVAALGACSSKTLQYPEDHERFRRIDQAVESLRNAYQKKNRSDFEAMMLPLDQLEQLQRDAEADFDAFHAITLEFKTERIMIEGDDIDVYVHWQGIWKKDPNDGGVRQRGHARLQWVGTHSILLRGVQGDLPFGMKTRQTFSEAASPQPPLR